MKDNQNTKKLVLNKKNIATLGNEKMGHVYGRGIAACWENLWTAYYCDVIYTRKEDPNEEE